MNRFLLFITWFMSTWFYDVSSTSIGIFIEAGSDSTTVHILSWQFVSVSSSSIPQIQEISKTRHPTSLYSIIGDIDEIKTTLQECLDFAKINLQEIIVKWNGIPLQIYFTGGIRALSPLERIGLITDVGEILVNSTILNPFAFNYPTSVTILSGEQEGLFTWLAINYHSISQQQQLQQQLQQQRFSLFPNTSVDLSTSGNIELNFISSHLAFRPHLSDTIQHTFDVVFPPSNSLPLYSMSYLSFGYNTIQDQYLEYLINIGFQQYIPQSAISPSQLDYCFYSGYRESFESSIPSILVEIYGPSVPAQDAMDRCLSSLLSFLTHSESTTHIYLERGEESGLLESVYQPTLSRYHDNGHNDSYYFVGTGLISYAAALLHLPPQWTLIQWKNAAKTLCGMSFHDVMIYATTSSTMSNEDREIYSSLLPASCLLTSYILILLKDGYGFDEQHVFTTQHVSTSVSIQELLHPFQSQKISQPNLIWGALLYRLSTFPMTYFETNKSTDSHLILSVVISSLIGLLVGILVTYYMAITKSQRNSYVAERDEIFEPPTMNNGTGHVYQEIVDQECDNEKNDQQDLSSYATLNRTRPNHLFPSN